MMNVFLTILASLGLQLVNEKLYAVGTCVEFFSNSAERNKRDAAADFLAYLANLLEQQIIGEPELHRLLGGLNPISEEKASVNSAALLHREEIQEYLDTTNLDTQKILLWAKRNLKEIEHVNVHRKETRDQTEDLHHKMIFYPISSGKFEMGEADKIVSVELTHAIEMMSTLVTQKHWLDLMGENPSLFKGLDNPVENVSWWSAVSFANKLSEQHGLRPAYDLTGVKFVGRLQDGSLDSVEGELRINAPSGDIYLAEGYRLPTNAEQEYVRKNLGQANGNYYFGDNEADLKNYAWYMENSDETTQPVAELKPLTIENKNFYDLYGNVWEWGQDWSGEHVGGKNPSGPSAGHFRVLRGGSFGSGLDGCCSAVRHYGIYPGDRDEYVGFRLVRTIR